jgi:diacylglycerol kinase
MERDFRSYLEERVSKVSLKRAAFLFRRAAFSFIICYNTYMINFRKLRLAFKVAFRGLGLVIREEQTFKIQVVVGALVVFFMFYFPLKALERTVLILAIVLVLSLELINSQIERILDLLQPNFDPKIRRIKDLSASAVLVVTIGSVFVGLLIFLPHVL